MVGQKHSWSMISEASWRSNAINVIFVKFLPIYRSDREVKASVRGNSFSARLVLMSVFRCMQNLLIAVSPRGFFTALDTKEFREVLRASFRWANDRFYLIVRHNASPSFVRAWKVSTYPRSQVTFFDLSENFCVGCRENFVRFHFPWFRSDETRTK